MKKQASLIACSLVMLAAVPAHAAFTGYLKIEGLDGESAEVAVDGWSFGVCQTGSCTRIASPRDAASGLATGKRQHKPVSSVVASQNTQSLRGGPRVAVGDVNGDGSPDFAFAGTLDEVSDCTLTFDKASPVLAKICGGKHFDKVVLRFGDESYEIGQGSGTCTASGDGSARTADQTPARLSTNFTVGKQTQGQTFGERVQSGMAQGGGWTVTFTGGQMKHQKTGHVTLLK